MEELSKERIAAQLMRERYLLPQSPPQDQPRSIFDNSRRGNFLGNLRISSSQANSLNAGFLNDSAKSRNINGLYGDEYLKTFKKSQYYDHDDEDEELTEEQLEKPSEVEVQDEHSNVTVHEQPLSHSRLFSGSYNAKVSDSEVLHNQQREHDFNESNIDEQSDIGNDYTMDEDANFYNRNFTSNEKTSNKAVLIVITSILIGLAAICYVSIFVLGDVNSGLGSYDSTTIVNIIPGMNKRLIKVEDELDEIRKGQSNLRANYNQLIDKFQLLSSDLELKVSQIQIQFGNYKTGFEKNVQEVAGLGDQYLKLNDHLKKVSQDLNNFKDQNRRSESMNNGSSEPMEYAEEDIDLNATHDYLKILEQIKYLESDMNVFKNKMDEYDEFKTLIEQRLEQLQVDTLDIIKNSIPERIPVSFDKESQTLDIVPEFDEYITELIESITSTKSLLEKGEKELQQQPITPSWDSFIETNEIKLKDFIFKQDLISADKFNKVIDSLKVNFNEELVVIKGEVLKQGIELKAKGAKKAANEDKVDLKFLVPLINKSIKEEINKLNLQPVKSNSQNKELEDFIEYNHADPIRGASIVKSLTKRTRKPRVRTDIIERIKYGYIDFFNRTFLGKRANLPGLFDINLLSSANSPQNLLVDDSDLIWQGLAKDLPIPIGIKLDKAIYLDEIQIKIPQKVSNAQIFVQQSMPKSISVYADLKDHTKFLKPVISKIYPSGELGSLEQPLSKLTKISGVELPWIGSISQSRSIISLRVPSAIKELLKHTKVQTLVVVLEDNFGGDYVVLEQVKVFGTSQFTEIKDLEADRRI